MHCVLLPTLQVWFQLVACRKAAMRQQQHHEPIACLVIARFEHDVQGVLCRRKSSSLLGFCGVYGRPVLYYPHTLHMRIISLKLTGHYCCSRVAVHSCI